MQSLHDAPYMDVGFKPEQDRVARPWGLVWESESDKTLPEDLYIESIFKDYAANALLILGSPGAGKTITLLDLTNYLLQEASRDKTNQEPIPVVFNLSSWGSKSLSLFDWLIDELKEKYGVPADLASFWLTNDALVLMLDGLDEMSKIDMEGCVEAINLFRGSHGFTRIAICSRVEEYEALTQALNLRGAVMVQPLSFKQADDYLAGFDEPLAPMRELFQTDEQLQTWAQTPLFLSVMAIAYHGLESEELQDVHTGSLNKLYETYVDRVLNKHRLDGVNQPRQFESEQIIKWLTWLAARMDEQKRTIYLIEHMQPDWLTLTPQEWKQQKLLVRFLRWVLGTLQVRANDRQWSWEAARAGGRKEISDKIRQVIGVLSGDLITVLVLALMFGGMGVLIGSMSLMLRFMLMLVLIGVLAFWVMGVLIGGLRGGPVRPNSSPNQGSWNNLYVGLMLVLMGVLFGGLFGVLIGGLSKGLSVVLIEGLMFGGMGVLLGGIWDFLRHFLLRGLLSRLGFLPRRVRDLVPFLDEAKENLLLRQVGGGYIFIHRTLLEYFAGLEKEDGA